FKGVPVLMESILASPASPIIGIVWIVWIEAARLHVLPNPVNAGFGHAVRRLAFPPKFPLKAFAAAAALCDTVAQAVSAHGTLFAADTTRPPKNAAPSVSLRVHSEHRPVAEAHSGEVDDALSSQLPLKASSAAF